MPILAHKAGDPVEFQDGIGDDFSILVKEYYPYIHRLALSILDDKHDADDAVQDAFIAAFQNLDRYRAEASVKTWLSAIAINICRGRLRKRKSQRNLQSTLQFFATRSTPVSSPEQATLQNESDCQVWQAVDALDEKHRLVVILHYVHDMSVPEIAKVLDVKQGTVYSRLHYARRKLYTALDRNQSQKEVHDGA